MTKINTNSAALLARAYGQKANQKMLKPMERLSSGLRINSASDDAAGLAVTNKMTSNIKEYDLSVKNGFDMINLLQTAESALAEISRIQQRLMELAVQSANAVYTQQDRDSMEMELIALVAEIDRIAGNTKFNDVTCSILTYNSAGHTVPEIKYLSTLVNLVPILWEDIKADDFENNDFSVQGPIVSISDTESRFPGWAVHKKECSLDKEQTWEHRYWRISRTDRPTPHRIKMPRGVEQLV